ncbi:hypothetical protein AA313_de0202406 [Arthrobotrys entomopaga]|nr:hypothetical protein AA313_de0202406 [Arthrobotrys entomopaga]
MAKRKKKSQQAVPQDKRQKNVPQYNNQQNACPPQVSPKLWKRFYEPLILLRVYGKSQGIHVKGEKSSCENYSDSNNKTIKKRFLDALAYSCDYEPGGDTVTAVAIQDAPELVYWVASNTDKRAKLEPHLNSILNLLSKAYNISADGVTALENKIFSLMVEFSSSRLRHYRAMLRGSIGVCIRRLVRPRDKETDSLTTWLVSLNDPTLDQAELCRICYQSRNSEILKIIRRRAGENSIHKSDSSNGAQYARICHYIGRLGSHMKAAQVLVETGSVCPGLFLNFSVQIATSHPSFIAPSYRKGSSIDGIINRMITDPGECKEYQTILHTHDKLFGLELQSRIKDEYESTKFKLRVHAEVILLDLFHRENFSFYEGVGYIGVSKPSCFLCDKYFRAHPLQVQTSGCSNNLYLQWQPPYVQESSPDSVKQQTQILNAMIQEVRRFVLKKIKPGHQRMATHPDSTTGFDTLSYVDRLEMPPREPKYREMAKNVSDEPASSSPDILSGSIIDDESEDGGVTLSSSVPEKSVETEEFMERNSLVNSYEYSDNSEGGGILLFT